MQNQVNEALQKYYKEQETKDNEARSNRKMYNSLSNCLDGNSDFISQIKTIEDFRIKKNYVYCYIEDLKKHIQETDIYMSDTFKGRMGKEKKEKQAKYMECQKEIKEQLRSTEKLYDTFFFDGSENKYS